MYARGDMAFSAPILLVNQYTLFTIDKRLLLKREPRVKKINRHRNEPEKNAFIASFIQTQSQPGRVIGRFNCPITADTISLPSINTMGNNTQIEWETALIRPTIESSSGRAKTSGN